MQQMYNIHAYIATIPGARFANRLLSCRTCRINVRVNVRELNQELVDCFLDLLELALEFTMLGGGDARSDDGSRDVTSASQCSL